MKWGRQHTDTRAKEPGKEDIVFTPFDESALAELKSWLLKDSSPEVALAFGSRMFLPSGINHDLLRSLLSGEATDLVSMMATIRTSYHTLIHIGYVQLKQTVQAGRNCYINRLYLSKSFRHKDYEYVILRKLVEFAVNDLHCDRCLIWISARNYLFLSIARTLCFRLVKMATGPAGTVVRYCYIVATPEVDDKMLAELESKYAIKIPEIPAARARIPDMAIPNYMNFKRRLRDINKLHEARSLERRSAGQYYSPVVKVPAKNFASEKQNKSTDDARDESSFVSNQRTNMCKREATRQRNMMMAIKRRREAAGNGPNMGCAIDSLKYMSPEVVRQPLARWEEDQDDGRERQLGNSYNRGDEAEYGRERLEHRERRHFGADSPIESPPPWLRTRGVPLPDIRRKQVLLKF